MTTSEWKEKRFMNMDGALNEIDAAACRLNELNDVADALEYLGKETDPDWMGYIFRLIGARAREMAYIGEELRELVNKGLTVKEMPDGKELTAMLTGTKAPRG